MDTVLKNSDNELLDIDEKPLRARSEPKFESEKSKNPIIHDIELRKLNLLKDLEETAEPLPKFDSPQIQSSKIQASRTRKFIYIGVISSADYLQKRGLMLWQTWGKYINSIGKIDFYIGEKNAAQLSPEVKRVLRNNIVRLRSVDDQAYPPQKKSLLMIKAMWKKHGKNFQWFMRADDDVYIKIERLEAFLRKLNSTGMHLLGQTGQGNSQEHGKLVLEQNDNYCMGGPGVIMSHSVLHKVGPNAPHCLRNHIYTSHEDVEVSRCIKKFAGIDCAWSYETARKFYEHFTERVGYINPWSSPYDLKLDYAITLHPNKKQAEHAKLHNYFQLDKIKEKQMKISVLRREIADVSDLLAKKKLVRDNLSRHTSMQRYKPNNTNTRDSSRRDTVLSWNNFNQQYIFSKETTRSGHNAVFKRVLLDINSQIVKYLNEDAVHKGREVSFQQVEHGYYRLDELHGADYVVDIRLLYKRFQKRHLQVLVRKHAYVQHTERYNF